MSLWDERGGSSWKPFIGEQVVASWPRMVSGRPNHVAKAPPFYPKGAVVELKREIVEKKGGKEGEGGWPATNLWLTGQSLASTQTLLSSSTSYCSSHAHSTDQRHQKQTQFLSSFPFFLFIYLF
jgi:hypothetical protein